MLAERARSLYTWMLWFAHTPMSAFWLLLAFMAVAGTIAIVTGRASPWEVLGSIGVVAGVTKLVARVKGVAAWPTRRAHEALRAESADSDERVQ